MIYVELLRPILFTLKKFRQNFQKNKRRGPPWRASPGYA